MMRYWIIVVVLSVLGGGQVLGTETVVVINEVLADPPSGDRGDANRDGIQNTYGDEFVEILNTGSRACSNRWVAIVRPKTRFKRTVHFS